MEENKIEQKETYTIKVPGNGLSIAGMVLGILGSVWTLLELISLGSIKGALHQFSGNTYYNAAIIGFSIGYTLFALIPSLIGLPLSIAGFTKYKSGKNITGLILNLLSLIASIIIIFYIISVA